jgi:hypothetical protein
MLGMCTFVRARVCVEARVYCVCACEGQPPLSILHAPPPKKNKTHLWIAVLERLQLLRLPLLQRLEAFHLGGQAGAVGLGEGVGFAGDEWVCAGGSAANALA